MKITLNFKTPDVMDQLEPLYEKSNNGNYNEIVECPHNDEIDKLKSFIKEFVKFGEYIEVEFDSELKTVKILKHCTKGRKT